MERTKTPKGKSVTSTSNENRSLITYSIYKKLIEQKDGIGCVALYSYFRSLVFEKKKDMFWANENYCIKGTGLNRKRFLKNRATLLGLKLIETIPVPRDNGKFGRILTKVNYTYEEISKVPSNPKKGTAPRSVKNNTTSIIGVAPRSVEDRITGNNTTNKEKGRKKVINNLLPPEEDDQSLISINGKITPNLFEQFWELYPKKVDRGKALTAWNKLCNLPVSDKPDWETIEHAVSEQKKSDRWSQKMDNQQFIPYPDKWLNESRWLDDPKTMLGIKKKEEFEYHYGIKYRRGEDGRLYHARTGTIYIP